MIYLAAFTEEGTRLALSLASGLGECCVCAPRRFCGGGAVPYGESLEAWTRGVFSKAEGLIFVGACGIAVRAIAPCLRGKERDPAVVAVDQAGRFAVALLSGHLGGANRLARRVAALCGAQPVITTATDICGVFAVDEWAATHAVAVLDVPLVKEISRRILAGEAVGFVSDFPVDGWPAGLTDAACAAGVCLSLDKTRRPFPVTLRLAPRIVYLGMGCRRNVDAHTLETLARAVLKRAGISRRAVAAVCTVERKADEPGLLALCGRWGVPLRVFSAEELMAAPGHFSASPFVAQVTGADNVCERAAVAASGGALLVGKTAENGATAALAVAPWRAEFSTFEDGGGKLGGNCGKSGENG